MSTPAIIWLAGSAACDVIIAAFMVYLVRASTCELYRADLPTVTASQLRKSATGFEGTDNVINRLTRMTIETGAVTAFAATLELICYLKWKENNLRMFPSIETSTLT